jgi:hypothetical protein
MISKENIRYLAALAAYVGIQPNDKGRLCLPTTAHGADEAELTIDLEKRTFHLYTAEISRHNGDPYDAKNVELEGEAIDLEYDRVHRMLMTRARALAAVEIAKKEAEEREQKLQNHVIARVAQKMTEQQE